MDKKYLIIILIILGLTFLRISFLYAQIFNNPRNNLIFRELERLDKARENIGYRSSTQQTNYKGLSRQEIIDQILRDISIELAFEYAFNLEGEQAFELELGSDVGSRLKYPFDGKLFIFKGEIGYLSKVFLGLKYATSQLKKVTCTDEDWRLWDSSWPYGSDEYVDYQISYQKSKTKLDFFDINLYYRILSLERKQMFEIKDYKFDELFENLIVDNFNVDILGGYQRYKARYRMIDPMEKLLRYDEGDWYYALGLPADIGLDSFYKIKYRGPKLGLRLLGSKGKFSSQISLAHIWLKTDAYGYWNLRPYRFWHRGRDGHGLNFELELNYNFNSNLSLGLGFNYFEYRQKKMKASGQGYYGPIYFEYYNEDIVRNANVKFHYPSLIFKYRW